MYPALPMNVVAYTVSKLRLHSFITIFAENLVLFDKMQSQTESNE